MNSIAILGSTGSIGRSTLDVISQLPDKFSASVLVGGSNWKDLAQQCITHKPQVVGLANPDHEKKLRHALQSLYKNNVSTLPKIAIGPAEIVSAIDSANYDVLVAAIVGFAGLSPTLSAIKRGKKIALANKESLVAAGKVFMQTALSTGSKIIPVDSEHSAIFQCLCGQFTNEQRSNKRGLSKIILTCSGGALRDYKGDIENVRPQDALAHPNWEMGQKITIDSASLMNKGLEVIEAHWLFDIAYDDIDVVIHPQSIVHSMVEFVDGSVLSQLGSADMRIPISYALAYPDRVPLDVKKIDFNTPLSLTFRPPDSDRFPCLRYAYEAGRLGGGYPAALNAANEVAVTNFLENKTRFSGIAKTVYDVMRLDWPTNLEDIDSIIEINKLATIKAHESAKLHIR